VNPGLLPAVLACTALALALSREQPRHLGLVASLSILAAPAGAQLQGMGGPGSPLAFALWTAMGAAAGLTVLRRVVTWRLLLALGAIIGFLSGAATGFTWSLPAALSVMALALPARWLARPGDGIALRVAASWLVAIAILNVALPLTTPTPGYAADHLE